MTRYTDRPWLGLYADGLDADLVADHTTMLGLFDATVARTPDAVAVRYFDGVLTFADLDARADALAAALTERGFRPGDRLAVYTQNNPAFVVGYLAAWKAGGAAVAVNPMNKQRELTYLLTDSGATALLCLEELYETVAGPVLAAGETQVTTVVTCSPLDDQTRDDPRLFAQTARARPAGTLDLRTVVEEYAGRAPPRRVPRVATWRC